VVAEFTSRKKTKIVNTSMSEVRLILTSVDRFRAIRFILREFFTVRLRWICP